MITDTKNNSQAPTALDSNNSCKKGVIILGETGVGKSNFGNFLIKDNKFEISPSPNSMTLNVQQGESKEIIVLDTPGVNDTSTDENIEEKHLIEITKAFKNEKNLNTILILLNYQTPRLSRNLKIMIKLFCSVFKISFFLKHLGIVFTRCFTEDGRPDDEELNQKRIEWDREIKKIIKNSLINEQLTEDKIQYFFVNLNPKKKVLDQKTEEEMMRCKLWIVSNEYMNTDIIKVEKNPGCTEKEEEEFFEEKSIEGENLIIKKFKKTRKKLIYVDGSIKYEGDWETSLIDEQKKPIEKFQELNSSIQQFKRENEDLINQLKDAKEKNSLELERLRLEYNARVEEAKARAEMMREDNRNNNFSNILGLIFGSIALGISKSINDE